MFTAEWCAACKADEPKVRRLESQGFDVERVDCDANPELVRRFQVTYIPAYFRKTERGWEQFNLE